MAEIVLEQVSKTFPSGVTAVRDLSLKAADGELLVLVGPSGCGKTTTLRLIAGLEEPTRGQIRINGRVVNDLPPRGRDVALVFQRPALYPHLSVHDNLRCSLEMRAPLGWIPRSIRRRLQPRATQALEQRVAAAARMLDLGEILERRPAELSGGQQQRVALGRALVREPAAFLLDEPLSGLDPPLRAEMRRGLHLLHRQLRATMIYVTHDQVEALTLGDRVAVMHGGTIQQTDRPAVLYGRPCNRFVAGFIGWPPMNFLDGQFEARDGCLGFSTLGCWLPLPAASVPRGADVPGRQATLGIRPRDVAVHDQPVGPVTVGVAVGMEVVLVEALGDGCLVTLRRGDGRLTALIDRTTGSAEGQTAAVSLDLARACWFDRSTGVTLATADG